MLYAYIRCIDTSTSVGLSNAWERAMFAILQFKLPLGSSVASAYRSHSGRFHGPANAQVRAISWEACSRFGASAQERPLQQRQHIRRLYEQVIGLQCAQALGVGIDRINALFRNPIKYRQIIKPSWIGASTRSWAK